MAVLHGSSEGRVPEGTSSQLSPTELPDAFYQLDRVQKITSFHMPRFDELPAIELYREQVIVYVEETLAPLAASQDEPWLTPSMVNNYVKHGLIPAPSKKAYAREHLSRLLAICVLKQLLPIQSVKELLSIQQQTYDLAVAYNYFAVEFEHALAAVFSSMEVAEDSATKVTRESQIIRCAVHAVASRIFLRLYLAHKSV